MIKKAHIIGVGLGAAIGIPTMFGISTVLKSQEQKIVGLSSQTTDVAPSKIVEIPKLIIRGNKSSRIYHFPNCVNYNDIAERNIVIFHSVAEAKARNFRLAKNCTMSFSNY
jgi:predicted small secreted protein